MERLVKSSERVRDLGEVFTPAETVNAMLDLLPGEMWVSHPSPTFLEPAAGNGNFLVAVLARKLSAIDRGFASRDDTSSRTSLGLEALSSIYGVDISKENVFGDSTSGEIGAQERLVRVFQAWLVQGQTLSKRDQASIVRVATWIVERNIILGNMLPFHADGTPSGFETLQVVEYSWDQVHETVSVRSLQFRDTFPLRPSQTTAVGLFDIVPEAVSWTGKWPRLPHAPVPLPVSNVIAEANSNGGANNA
jgi:hypothetical protein